MTLQFTRKFTPSSSQAHTWFVLIGEDCAIEREVVMLVPDEKFVRRLFDLPKNIPILIGRP